MNGNNERGQPAPRAITVEAVVDDVAERMLAEVGGEGTFEDLARALAPILGKREGRRGKEAERWQVGFNFYVALGLSRAAKKLLDQVDEATGAYPPES